MGKRKLDVAFEEREGRSQCHTYVSLNWENDWILCPLNYYFLFFATTRQTRQVGKICFLFFVSGYGEAFCIFCRYETCSILTSVPPRVWI